MKIDIEKLCCSCIYWIFETKKSNDYTECIRTRCNLKNVKGKCDFFPDLPNKEFTENIEIDCYYRIDRPDCFGYSNNNNDNIEIQENNYFDNSDSKDEIDIILDEQEKQSRLSKKKRKEKRKEKVRGKNK